VQTLNLNQVGYRFKDKIYEILSQRQALGSIWFTAKRLFISSKRLELFKKF
jgi:hypothetical protein